MEMLYRKHTYSIGEKCLFTVKVIDCEVFLWSRFFPIFALYRPVDNENLKGLVRLIHILGNG